MMFSIFITSQLYAQEEEDFDNPRMMVKLSPLSLIDIFDNPSLRLGSEINVYKNVSLEIEAGTYFKDIYVHKLNGEGYLFKPSIKLYTYKGTDERSDKCMSYLSLEYMNKFQRYNVKDSISINGYDYQKKYQLRRKVDAFSLKAGTVYIFKKRFVLEFYGGVGIRFSSTKSDISQIELDNIIPEFDESTPDTYAKNIGNCSSINMILGIKVGYVLFE
ncbi:hypothetical protein [Aureivirga sp. CE67]|uniref:hypothetical protein n=1 Tax=Aureivirga sp. CE67 TaxID=1788983 RepID=UPI0018CAE495|nr:hypothetical protein [Aureivirga sp. CE67]